MMDQAVGAVRWTAISNLLRGAIGVVQIVTLARLIEHSDFGLMAQAVAVIGVLQLATDVGLSNAIIRFREIPRVHLSTLFWLNFAMGILLTALVLAAANPLSWYFGDPRLSSLLCYYSPVFIIIACGQQFRALAEKNFEFSSLAKIEVGSSLVGLCVAVAAALLNAGAGSLVAGAIATTFSFTLLCWVTWSAQYAPRLEFALSGIKKYVSFGLHVVGSNLTSAIGAQADIFVFGRMFSSNILGYYSQTRELNMRLITVVNPIISRVNLPLISLKQSDKSAVAQIYSNTVLISTSITMPVYFAVAVLSPELVTVLLGPNWTSAADFLQATALWCAVRAIGNPIGALLNGMGWARAGLFATLVVTGLTFLFAVAGSYVGGALGVPYSLLILNVLVVLGHWYFLIRHVTGLSFSNYMQQIARPLLASVIAAFVSEACLFWMLGTFARLAVGSVVFGAFYLASSFVVNRRWLEMMIRAVKPKVAYS